MVWVVELIFGYRLKTHVEGPESYLSRCIPPLVVKRRCYCTSPACARTVHLLVQTVMQGDVYEWERATLTGSECNISPQIWGAACTPLPSPAVIKSSGVSGAFSFDAFLSNTSATWAWASVSVWGRQLCICFQSRSCRTRGGEVTKYKYFVTVLKWHFQVSVLCLRTYFADTFCFNPTF